jgi:hypothetical protein
MSDPRHSVKVVIVVQKGCVNQIVCDRSPGNIDFYVADYDNLDPYSDFDKHGRPRSLELISAWIDTPMVRGIINKKKGKEG